MTLVATLFLGACAVYLVLFGWWLISIGWADIFLGGVGLGLSINVIAYCSYRKGWI